ncbi:MAG TPA: hypothetical protein DCS93_16180 [Microscillaceae bacterium]|nr:hypothetical protein [Microscillaceae bacterium]
MMTLELNLKTGLNILLLLGALQGLIVALMLMFKKPYKLASQLLAIWIICLALYNIRIIILTSDLYKIFGQRYTLLAPLYLNFWYGPLIWLFSRKITRPQHPFILREWLHLLPGLLQFIYLWVIYAQPLRYRQWFYGAIHWRYVEPVMEVIATLGFVAYLWAAAQLIQTYGKQVKEAYADPNLETYQWLKRFLRLLAVFSLLWLVLTLIDVFLMQYQMKFIYFYPYFLMIAFLSYFIGFSAYFRSEQMMVVEVPKVPEKTTSTSLVDQQQLITQGQQLKDLMQTQQLYLKSTLRAKEVADLLGVNVQTLSLVLNQGLGVSFHDFVNEWRVNHVKSRLASDDIQRISLLGIAKESGFNSETSFYRIFKKFTGVTPKGYLQSLKKSQS